MTPQKNFITVTLRSHLIPSAYIEGFAVGKKIKIKTASDITLREFAQEFFFQNKHHIGIIAVNGISAQDTKMLQEGDLVDIYSLMSGG